MHILIHFVHFYVAIHTISLLFPISNKLLTAQAKSLKKHKIAHAYACI